LVMEESSATDAQEAKAMLKSLHFRPSISNNGGKQKTNAPKKKSQQWRNTAILINKQTDNTLQQTGQTEMKIHKV
jgi:hypothetical protein